MEKKIAQFYLCYHNITYLTYLSSSSRLGHKAANYRSITFSPKSRFSQWTRGLVLTPIIPQVISSSGFSALQLSSEDEAMGQPVTCSVNASMELFFPPSKTIVSVWMYSSVSVLSSHNWVTVQRLLFSDTMTTVWIPNKCVQLELRGRSNITVITVMMKQHD